MRRDNLFLPETLYHLQLSSGILECIPSSPSHILSLPCSHHTLSLGNGWQDVFSWFSRQYLGKPSYCVGPAVVTKIVMDGGFPQPFSDKCVCYLPPSITSILVGDKIV